MRFLELLLTGVALAMDAFAVSMCKGLAMKKLNIKNGLIIALFFGVAQGIMPVIGWLLGTQFEKYITSIDHWIAFALLVFIGAKMLWDVFRGEEDDPEKDARMDLRELFILAIATSIDALAVGITLAFIPPVTGIAGAASIIAAVTFIICLAGVVIGNLFGVRFKTKAQIAGGVVLILIGVKILLEHLGVLNF